MTGNGECCVTPMDITQSLTTNGLSNTFTGMCDGSSITIYEVFGKHQSERVVCYITNTSTCPIFIIVKLHDCHKRIVRIIPASTVPSGLVAQLFDFVNPISIKIKTTPAGGNASWAALTRVLACVSCKPRTASKSHQSTKGSGSESMGGTSKDTRKDKDKNKCNKNTKKNKSNRGNTKKSNKGKQKKVKHAKVNKTVKETSNKSKSSTNHLTS